MLSSSSLRWSGWSGLSRRMSSPVVSLPSPACNLVPKSPVRDHHVLTHCYLPPQPPATHCRVPLALLDTQAATFLKMHFIIFPASQLILNTFLHWYMFPVANFKMLIVMHVLRNIMKYRHFFFLDRLFRTTFHTIILWVTCYTWACNPCNLQT